MSRSTIFVLALTGMILFNTPSAFAAEELQCADKPVSARGQGFSPSPEQSAEKAKEEWLKKAQAIYGDAQFETAKNPEMQCVNQGLYSNCKLTAVPCGGAKADAANKNDSANKQN